MFETLAVLVVLISSLSVLSVALIVSMLHRPRGDLEDFVRRHSVF